MASDMIEHFKKYSSLSTNDVEIIPIIDTDDGDILGKINEKSKELKTMLPTELSDLSEDEDNINNIQTSGKLLQETDNQRKAKRNRGETYITKSGKNIRAKKFQNKDCKCTKKCKNLVNEKERHRLFEFFWNLGDFNKQNIFLNATILRTPIKRRRSRTAQGPARNCNFTYYLQSGNKVNLVCKRFFMDTFDISEGRLYRAINAKLIGQDMRGRTDGSCRKTDEELLANVREHIQSFPPYEAPCTCTHDSGKTYLSPELTVRKMYNLYVEKCKENNATSVSEQIYRKIFRNEFNLYFYQPKDTCQKCALLNMMIDTIKVITENAPQNPT